MAAEAKINEAVANEMLADGATVRDVAEKFGVTTQAVYLAIGQGRITRPQRSAMATGGRAA